MTLAEIDCWCDLFEQRLKAGEVLSAERFVADQELPANDELLVELCKLEHEYLARVPASVRNQDLDSPELACQGILEQKLGATVTADDITLSYVVTDSHGVHSALLNPATSASHTPFAAGLTVDGRYLLKQEVGRGGMGRVFLGRDLRLDRPVAIKVMLPSRRQSSPEAQVHLELSFIREAKLGANLVHPAIATVYDFGVHDGQLYTVFEYVSGPSLRQMMQKRRVVPLDDVRLIVGPLAQGLDYAHANRVIHRDLKPENIKAAEQGSFKILDLGLAKEFDRADEWRFAGTPAYASPEQASEAPSDGRADQYSLGVIVYEMLTGHRPFAAQDPVAMLELHRAHVPADPREFVPDLPSAVGAAILRALEKDPNKRFATCQDFASALGCPMLGEIASVPDILAEHAVQVVPRRMRFAATIRAHSILTRDTHWLLHREQIRALSVCKIEKVDRRRRQVRVSFHDGPSIGQYRFRFARNTEAAQWCAIIHDLIRAAPQPTDTAGSERSQEPVVLVRRRPNLHFQLLGTIDAHGKTRSYVEDALRLRGALLGADAIVDVQEERVSSFGAATRRLSGVAVRSVDQTGKLELRARAFCEQSRKLGNWMFMLTVSFLLFNCVSAALFSGLNIALLRGQGIPVSLTATVLQIAGFLVLSFGWPLVMALLIRTLQWPQLARPAAITFYSLATAGIVAAFSAIVSGSFSGAWISGVVRAALLLDPGNLAVLIFGMFIARRSWNLYRGYQVLVPADQKLVRGRRFVLGHAAWWGSVVFAVALWGYHGYGGYEWVKTFNLNQFRSAFGIGRREPEPMRHIAFDNGGVVFYSSGANRTDAQVLGDFQSERGFFEHGVAHVYISRDMGGTCVKFVVQDGAWNDSDVLVAFEGIGAQLAREHFGTPLRVELCDPRYLITQRMLAIEAASRPRFPDVGERLEASIKDSERIVELQPNDAGALSQLADNLAGLALVRLSHGDDAEYVSLLRRAVDFRARVHAKDPENPRVRNGVAAIEQAIAWVLATHPDSAMRHGDEAVERAERACELTNWARPGYLDTLAAAYAETGKFDKAVEYESRAINTTPDDELRTRMQTRLDLYRAGTPFRQPHRTERVNVRR